MVTERLVRAGTMQQFAQDTIACTLNLTDLCNFTCSYCINRHSRTNRVLDINILEHFLQDLGERKASCYAFGISGGEPLLYQHMDSLLFYIDKYIPNQKHVTIATNGSLLHKHISSHKEYVCNTTIKYMISIHIEQIEIDTYVNNLLKIKERDNIACKILLYPGKLFIAKKLYNIFKSIGIDMCIQTVYMKSHALEYSDDELEFLRSFSSFADTICSHEYEDSRGTRRVEEYCRSDISFSPEKFSYKGMFCAAGMNTLRLGPDGVVVPCFGFMRRGMKFDLKQRRLRDTPELQSPCICPDDRCGFCEGYLQTPKWRDAADAPGWLLQKGTRA
ncbi:radical SAM protein [uncultured Desulfovibrio sp.]|uniref:radical SAM protein n=2 Tax=uncultured Desulfovibrio sp. TaxID=167968 RepID=UPI00262D0E32|nr:radical SAM protein [uncultured Desulfovibrio sp.]